MENKELYFTPKISDIKVGYKCELLELSGKLLAGTIPDTKWVKYTIEDFYDFNNVWDLYNEGKLTNIRTPYLTKEDIESLGWVMSDTVSDYCFGVKGNYELTYSFVNKLLRIRDMSDSKHPYPILHNCFCPSVNELIYICKLLKIK